MSQEDARLKVLLVGGGTGGHITPLMAIADEIKKIDRGVEINYVAERGSRFARLTRASPHISGMYFVRAGKFRRYHGESWLARLVDVRTNLLNARDLLFTIVGIWQAVGLMDRLKPDVVFIKGGFVAVPLGMAARLRRVPFITHDSDVVPGLANRLIGRWAALRTVGLAVASERDSEAKLRHVGIPVSANFKPVNESQKARLKRQLGLAETAQLALITGGSQGARSLNQLVDGVIERLMSQDLNLYVVHQTGEPLGGPPVSLARARLVKREFLPDLYRYSAAADLIIARAGATAIAEFALQGKACIVIPHAHLPGGHQLKNAALLRASGAAVVIEAGDAPAAGAALVEAAAKILRDGAYRRRLEANIAKLARPDAARRLARLIVDLGHGTV